MTETTRRDVLRAAAVGGAVVAAAAVVGGAVASGPTEAPAPKPATGARMPTLFLAHGAPPILEDQAWMATWHAWANALPRPTAVLMLSAHWEAKPTTIGATTTVPLIYDFYGFPPRYYETKYPAPGAPALAERVRALLTPGGPVAEDPARGLDHGAFVPLIGMYPQADVPVLQISLPSQDPKALWALGQRLAPLRDEGVLIMGSGFLSHNLRALDFRPNAPVVAWAQEFDAWCAQVLSSHDVDALLDYRNKAPAVRLALPTHEHFIPVITAMGAAEGAATTFPVTGIWAGSLTKRSAQFG